MQSREIGKYIYPEDIFNKDVLNNLEHVRKESSTLDEEYYFNDLLFKDVLKEPLFAKGVSLYFVNQLFNGKYTLQYRKFYDRSETLDEQTMNDLNIDGFVIGELHRKRVSQIALPEGNTFNELTVYLHEFSHYLNFKECPKMHYDNILTEVHSIFIQHLFKDFCERNDLFRECGDLNYIYHYNCAMSYLYRPDINLKDFIPGKEELKIPYDVYMELIEMFLYYYGYIYSNRLYEFYLDDEKKFLKRYMGIYNGQSLDELLEYYGINMYEHKNIEPTLKLIKELKK